MAANAIPRIIQPIVSSQRGSHNMIQTMSPGPEETDQRGSPSILGQFSMEANNLLEIRDTIQPTEASQRESHTPLNISPRLEHNNKRFFSPSICERNINDTSCEIPAPITPEMIKPYPKAPPRKNGTKGRKKGSSQILTDTPEKNAIEAAHLNRLKKLEKSAIRPRTKEGRPSNFLKANLT